MGFKLKQEFKILPSGIEGVGGRRVDPLDYLDFIVHVFTPEAREFYRLDVLWKSAPVEVDRVGVRRCAADAGGCTASVQPAYNP